MSILKNRRKKRPLEFYKRHETDQVWWVHDPHDRGPLLISFDGETVFNLWQDYPHNLTKEQKELFDKENPFWADMFRSRCK